MNMAGGLGKHFCIYNLDLKKKKRKYFLFIMNLNHILGVYIKKHVNV